MSKSGADDWIAGDIFFLKKTQKISDDIINDEEIKKSDKFLGIKWAVYTTNQAFK